MNALTDHALKVPRSVTKDARTIQQVLAGIARKYPADLIPGQLEDIPRIAYHIELIAKAKGFDARVCDIGGGIGLFSVGCAAMGMDSVLVDDFRDTINDITGERMLDLHRQYGVQIITCDVVKDRLDVPPESFDALTSFHSMEHWHHSPKAFFKQVLQSLKPDGLFLLCGPNSVNLRKRFTVALGVSNWSSIEEWYDEETFRGHVREPHTRDLAYIARDLALRKVNVFGRNWLASQSRSKLVRKLTPFADPLLNKFPSLCSDIYMSGYKA